MTGSEWLKSVPSTATNRTVLSTLFLLKMETHPVSETFRFGTARSERIQEAPQYCVYNIFQVSKVPLAYNREFNTKLKPKVSKAFGNYSPIHSLYLPQNTTPTTLASQYNQPVIPPIILTYIQRHNMAVISRMLNYLIEIVTCGTAVSRGTALNWLRQNSRPTLQGCPSISSITTLTAIQSTQVKCNNSDLYK